MADMYNWDKSVKRNKQNPSFSSCLLDEIYRSIDGGDEKFGEFKLRKQKVAKKQSVKSGCSRGKSCVEIAEASLVEKWKEMKGKDEEVNKIALDHNDPLFFSSDSSSSDSSFGWYSEAEAVKPKPSCFGPSLSRVKTAVSVAKKQNVFDDDGDSGLARSKTRALKLYTSLKKVKQPISPGGRLTTFLNAIFTTKKSKDSADCQETRKSKSTKIPPRRTSTVGFLNRQPYDHRDDQDIQKWVKPNFSEFFMKYNYDKKIDIVDEDEDDMTSDSSSDLFELDHLEMLQNCEDLPVYETTHITTNRAIASGLIC